MDMCSSPAVLTFGPRFSGALHSPFTRRDVQMSSPPYPPGRVDVQNASLPSAEKKRQWSLYVEFTGGSPGMSLRFCGSDQPSLVLCDTHMSLSPSPPRDREELLRLDPESA